MSQLVEPRQPDFLQWMSCEVNFQGLEVRESQTENVSTLRSVQRFAPPYHMSHLTMLAQAQGEQVTSVQFTKVTNVTGNAGYCQVQDQFQEILQMAHTGAGDGQIMVTSAPNCIPPSLRDSNSASKTGRWKKRKHPHVAFKRK